MNTDSRTPNRRGRDRSGSTCWRRGVVAGALLAVAALGLGCSSGDSQESVAAFCAEMEVMGETEPQTGDDYRAMGDRLGALDAPTDIAAEVQELSGGFRELGDALDAGRPMSDAEIDEQFGNLDPASDRVGSFLEDECDVDLADS